MSGGKRRESRREQLWRETFSAWQKSGQSVRAFCSGRGLRESSFYFWRRVLRERARSRSATPRLVPLRVVADAVLEVVLPAGLVVRVPARMDAAAVTTAAQLVAALRATSC